MLDEVYKKSQSIMYIGDKENSNTDSALVSTKRSLIFNELNKELYKEVLHDSGRAAGPAATEYPCIFMTCPPAGTP